jgi:glucose-6-phosphate dehydrogenase assembly protein OpcA
MRPEALTWSGEDVHLTEVERQLSGLRCERDGAGPELRTSVLTHIAWVPAKWREAADTVLEELRERHPSRTIMLYPNPEDERDAIDAEVAVETFELPGLERRVATEVVRLSLCNGRVQRPASIVLPLLIADLPVFLRWRGRPDFYHGPFEQLAEVVDRLVVDTGEWDGLPGAYADLAEFFARVAVSDIAWARTARWRQALAGLWPGIAEASKLRVEGPQAEALLLAGWLRSRLDREFELEHADASELSAVAVDGENVEPAPEEPKSASDLLSDQLEIFGRDRIYERAVKAVA